MPRRSSATKKETKPKASEDGSVKAKRAASRKKKKDIASDQEFKMSEESAHNSEMEEEKDGDTSDVEALEDLGDEKERSGKGTKRVKKANEKNARGSSQKKGKEEEKKEGSRGRRGKKEAAEQQPAQKGNADKKIVRRIQFNSDEYLNSNKEFFVDEDDETSHAYIPQFITEPHIRDKNGKAPKEAGYDKKTLFIPPNEAKKFSPVMKQYWESKSQHFDKLVAIKVWKFYYFYFQDAFIVHRVLDMKLTMTKSSTSAFFHESCLKKFAPRLLAAGHQIVVIEQMEETKQNKDEVIRREICQILTKGSAVENQELDYSSRFLLAVFEEDLNFGVAFIDTTTHEFYIGEFKDDAYRSNLRTLVTRIKPVEIVYREKKIEKETLSLFKSLATRPVESTVEFKLARRFKEILDRMGKYFTKKDTKEKQFPELIEKMEAAIDEEMKKARILAGEKLSEYEKEVPFYATMQALAIATEFLEAVLLAETVLAMGNFLPFDLSLEKKGTLYLDSQSLENLEVLDVEYLKKGSESSSLFGYMDKTVSAFGKRMLKRWVTSPLLDEKRIKERQEAVEELSGKMAMVEYYQSRLGKFMDLERLVNRMYNLSDKKRMAAVYYESFAKNRLKEFLAFLKEMRKIEDLIEGLGKYVEGLKSSQLRRLCCFKDVDIEAFEKRKKKTGKKENEIEEEEKEERLEGGFPRINHILADLEAMVVIEEDAIFPAPGFSKESDERTQKITEVKADLNKYLGKQREIFKTQDIKYVHSKHRYELEVPQALVEGAKRPKDFSLTSKRIGYQRFMTPEIEGLKRKLWRYEGELKIILIPFICDYFRKFYERNSYWQQVISCLGELDCLCSLARLANAMPVKCRPEVLPMGEKPVFELKEMVHPMAARNNAKFVPNDVIVEDDAEIFLITGPNMGGKSTLLRQTCLAVIMAQVGSFVPAKSMRLSAVDRIFTRVGASDRIFEGKSTFFVEMEETKNIVSEATRNSLLIIDELGRGTSTYDGVAIAYATLKFIAEKIGSITLFATHYHLLLEEFRLYRKIETYFMQCQVEEGKDEIKFLYKFGKGQAIKSHGIIIAKVAGLPEDVIEVAKERAAFLTVEKGNIEEQTSLLEKFHKVIQEIGQLTDAELQNPDAVLEKLEI